MEHKAYPSIEQFRNAIRAVTLHARYIGKDENGDAIYDNTKELPVLKYLGQIKTHGTNSAIAYNKSGDELWFQSRENIIAPEKDNAGFARHFSEFKSELIEIFNKLPGNEVIIYGEWIGKGIQKNVGVSELSKRIIVFDITSDNISLASDQVKRVKNHDIAMYNIYDFPTFEIEIDFNKPELSQNKLVELTIEVEKKCPVAAAFGIEGIGEGICWKSQTEGYRSSKFSFKCKGELHSKSKVKTLNPVDNDKIANLQRVALLVTPDWRLEQMLEKACDLNNGGFIDRKNMGEYLKLVNNDICKEDLDILRENGVSDFKEIVKYVGESARKYFFEQEKSKV